MKYKRTRTPRYAKAKDQNMIIHVHKHFTTNIKIDEEKTASRIKKLRYYTSFHGCYPGGLPSPLYCCC
jgi:hypothetical protein